MRETELLAPAGSYQAMEAAVSAGADAVYIGGSRFGARAYADNPDEEGILRAIDYVHVHGKRLYLTVNTLLKDQELEEELYQYLLPFYREGLDAVIVQDLGVLRFVRRMFPELPIHASTQMTVTGVESARLLKEAGAVRVVTARELSLPELSAIYQATHMEIESFVHGALCYCYSGQCLMSSLIGGRSGNRGRCAQPCRLPYQVWQGSRRLNDERTAYPLSPKDMCTVSLLPQILEAGVHSLKIEGRMKKPEYTAGVVAVYRKYLDRYLAGDRECRVSREDYQKLLDIYNRDGFHQGYYQQKNGRNMMALRNEKKTREGRDIKNVRNEQLFDQIRREYLETKPKRAVQGVLSLYPGCPACLELSQGEVRVSAEGEMVQQAQSRPLEEERVRRQMMKTGATEFEFSRLTVFLGDQVFLPMQHLNELRRKGLEALREAILDRYRRRTEEGAGTDPFMGEKTEAGQQEKAVPEDSRADEADGQVKPEGEELFLSALVTTRSQLDAVLEVGGIRRIYVECGMWRVPEFAGEAARTLERVTAAGKEMYLALPYVVRDRELDGRKEHFSMLCRMGLSGFLVRNLESAGVLAGMGLSGKTVWDAGLYTMNGQARREAARMGAAGDTVPLELNQKELLIRDNRGSELVVYGYLPMMISAQCLKKNLDGCDGKCAVLTVKDRYMKEFHAVCSCEFCYNILYNTVPLSLLGDAARVRRLEVTSLRLSFTLEDKKTAESIARAFEEAYLQGRKETRIPVRETTRGHFSRGVE